MPQCHKCPHDGHPTEACIECAIREERRERYGADLSDRAVSLDALMEAGCEPRPWHPSPEALNAVDEREGQADASWREKMLDFLHGFLALDTREQRAICLRLDGLRMPGRGVTLQEIGTEIGMRDGCPDGSRAPLSKQYTRHLILNGIAKVPALRSLFPGMRVSFSGRQRAWLEHGPPPQQRFLGTGPEPLGGMRRPACGTAIAEKKRKAKLPPSIPDIPGQMLLPF